MFDRIDRMAFDAIDGWMGGWMEGGVKVKFEFRGHLLETVALIIAQFGKPWQK